MNLFEKLQIDTRWKLVFLIGVGCIIISGIMNFDFVANKHLFGLGLGCIVLALGYYRAWKDFSYIKPPNFYTGGVALVSGKLYDFDFFSKVCIIVGVILCIVFLFLIIWNLF